MEERGKVIGVGKMIVSIDWRSMFKRGGGYECW